MVGRNAIPNNHRLDGAFKSLVNHGNTRIPTSTGWCRRISEPSTVSMSGWDGMVEFGEGVDDFCSIVSMWISLGFYIWISFCRTGGFVVKLFLRPQKNRVLNDNIYMQWSVFWVDLCGNRGLIVKQVWSRSEPIGIKSSNYAIVSRFYFGFAFWVILHWF